MTSPNGCKQVGEFQDGVLKFGRIQRGKYQDNKFTGQEIILERDGT